jgi:hypothetical protein
MTLPQAIRSAELRVRLPRHHIDMLHYRADQQETTVSGVLERELDGIAAGVRRGDGVAVRMMKRLIRR